ncbi:MAG: hypothetical protein MZV70_01150 [Desulfobacterales bacterium]|nr:hypothetical protein [Desulfobacterales bacterium]
MMRDNAVLSPLSFSDAAAPAPISTTAGSPPSSTACPKTLRTISTCCSPKGYRRLEGFSAVTPAEIVTPASPSRLRSVSSAGQGPEEDPQEKRACTRLKVLSRPS